MYLVSDNVGHRLINTKDLVKPNTREKALIQDAYKKLPSLYKNINVKWFVKKAGREETTIAGMATLLSPEETSLFLIPQKTNNYAICISSYVFKESYEYIIYILTHELKHCIPETSIYGRFSFFRRHEVNLWGKSSKKEDTIFGFFKDEFQDISCCDNLMYMFKGCHGIEEFLSWDRGILRMKICPKNDEDRCSRCDHSIPHTHIKETGENTFDHCDHINKACPACVEVKEMEFLTSKEMQI